MAMESDGPSEAMYGPLRNYLGAQVLQVRWLPSGSAGPHGDGTSSRPFVSALWDEDSQCNMLTISKLDYEYQGTRLTGALPDTLQAARVNGSTRDLTVAQLHDTAIILAAGSDGCISRLGIKPRPFASENEFPYEITTGSLTGHGELRTLEPWLQLHSGPVASVDYQRLSHNVLTVGEDGAIHVLPVDAPGSSGNTNSRRPYRAANGVSAYSQGRWSDSHTFITAGIAGGLQMWDIRQRASSNGASSIASSSSASSSRPVRRSPLQWGHTGCDILDAAEGASRQIMSLAVHPSRPNIAASGSASGSVALWDLRFEARPVCTSQQQSDAAVGNVWQLQFDVSEAAAAPPVAVSTEVQPVVLYCTEGGCIMRAAIGDDGGLDVSAVLKESAAVVCFDAEPIKGLDLLCGVASECLLYLQR